VLVCDVFLVVTATFRRLYGFVLIEIARRQVLYWNVTNHPTAEWTIQQLRHGVPLELTYRFVVHDRDGIFAFLADGRDDATRDSDRSLSAARTPRRRATATW